MKRYRGFRRPYKPLPTGKVVARCIYCSGEAVADGKGTPVVLRHTAECPELSRYRHGGWETPDYGG